VSLVSTGLADFHRRDPFALEAVDMSHPVSDSPSPPRFLTRWRISTGFDVAPVGRHVKGPDQIGSVSHGASLPDIRCFAPDDFATIPAGSILGRRTHGDRPERQNQKIRRDA
jgi:hypothetical protein